MLRRINGALYEAPEGARIEVVTDAQNNNGVRDARFEYGGRELSRELILGLPGCSFIVETSRQQLEAVVVFDPAAPGAARYDLFEVENGVQNALDKFTLKSDQSNQIAFAIDPIAVAVAAGAGRRGVLVRKRRRPAARRKGPRKRPVAKKPVRKAPRRTTKKAAKRSKKTAARTQKSATAPRAKRRTKPGSSRKRR